jgi:hypothetical protein
MMIQKNRLTNARTSCVFILGSMEDFFPIEEDLFDDY